MPSDIALYIHWPFCVSKCPYCDFNSHVAETVDQARWTRALIREMDWFAADAAARRLTSIFFGGGTPSLMAAETVTALIEAARRRWPPTPDLPALDLEVTLEANPSSVEAQRFEAYRAAGVNRLSLGVQSFDDGALKFLERAHDSSAARRALAIAAETFPRFSFDLIYARPGQSEDDWRTELGVALGYADSHLSVYQLTIEPGTRFAKDRVPAADEDLASRMFEATAEVLGGAGLDAYEISNHARPGHECRHNLTYWRGEDYIGIGPGAHGRLHLGAVTATAQRRKPETWLDLVEAQGHGTELMNAVPPAESAEEMLMMGLRTLEGVDLARLAAVSGGRLDDAVDPARLADLVDQGMLERTADALKATPQAWPVLNEVIRRLLG